MKPKVFLYNTALFAQICYIAGPSLSKVSKNHWKQLTTLGCANVKPSINDKSLIIMICAVIPVSSKYTHVINIVVNPIILNLSLPV